MSAERACLHPQSPHFVCGGVGQNPHAPQFLLNSSSEGDSRVQINSELAVYKKVETWRTHGTTHPHLEACGNDTPAPQVRGSREISQVLGIPSLE